MKSEGLLVTVTKYILEGDIDYYNIGKDGELMLNHITNILTIESSDEVSKRNSRKYMLRWR